MENEKGQRKEEKNTEKETRRENKKVKRLIYINKLITTNQ